MAGFALIKFIGHPDERQDGVILIASTRSLLLTMRSFLLAFVLGVLAMTGPALASGGFAGTWKIDSDIVRTMTLDSAGNGSMIWQPRSGQGDGGPIAACVPAGDDTVNCGWNATYFDHDKTIVRHGTLTMHVDDDALLVTRCTMIIDSEDWHVETYPSSAEFCGPTRWTRVEAEHDRR
jgi:hypothetical protein